MDLRIEHYVSLVKILHINTHTLSKDTDHASGALYRDDHLIGIPAYPFLHVPDVLRMFKKPNGRRGSSRYPCGSDRYCTITIEDYLPKQRKVIIDYIAITHSCDAVHCNR